MLATPTAISGVNRPTVMAPSLFAWNGAQRGPSVTQCVLSIHSMTTMAAVLIVKSDGRPSARRADCGCHKSMAAMTTPTAAEVSGAAGRQIERVARDEELERRAEGVEEGGEERAAPGQRARAGSTRSEA